ncbi:hypothetical protein K3495_g3687 [Podosphaera aphanis]|nr:hypothetical protein K3495_g3687 [Podosphaera aphanis]
MSFVRGFSVRRKSRVPEPVSGYPSRSLSMKSSVASGSIRHKISAPTKLISTSSLLTSDVPEIHSQTPRSSLNSTDSDSSVNGSISSFTSPDSSSIESSSPVFPTPNHLSCYFGCPVPGDEPPSIPRRSPSHTTPKRSMENFLSRKLSSRLSSSSRKTKSMARSSLGVFFPLVEAQDQMGSDPEHGTSAERPHQLDAKQEAIDMDQEELELLSRGFHKFRAEDYVNEIHGIYVRVFDDFEPITNIWI